MANNYPEKTPIDLVGVSRYRDVTAPITLSIDRTSDESNVDMTDNFPKGLTADDLVGAVLLENGRRRLILSAEDGDDAVKFTYHNGTENVTLLYSKVYSRVFASAAEIAAYDDLEALAADVDIAADEDLLGKVVADLQEDVDIEDGVISGTLHFIDDYSSAGFVGDESSGNFIALHFEVPDVNDVTIQVTLTKTVALDADGLIVCRIANKDVQTLTVTASKIGCRTVTKVFALSGLTCEAAPGE